MNAEINELIRRFLEGELDPAEEESALHRIATHENGRGLLRQEYEIHRFFFEDRTSEVAVPEGFADRVMLALEPAATPAEARPTPALDFLKRLWNSLAAPRPVVMRPVYALALLLVMVASGLVGGILGSGESEESAKGLPVAEGPGDEEILMQFIYVDPQASRVEVAGDFTDWEPVALSSREVEGQQVWTSVIPVPRGEHRYMFVIDGVEWVSDPLAPVQRDDGFGHQNAVLIL